MDVQELDQSVEFYFQNGLAGSTRKTYSSAKHRYAKFCSEKGFSPLPTSENLLCRYVSSLANENISHNTIKCYLSAIRHLHIEQGFGDPNISEMARLEQVLKGIKSTQAKKINKRVRLPITPDLLRKMRAAWLGENTTRDGGMLWAAASLCFFAFLRSGEITVPSDTAYDEGAHLSFGDFTVDDLDNPTTLKVRIKASKTDPFRKGVDIYVGRTGDSLCPVSAVLSYMVARGKGAGPFFIFQAGTPLTRMRFVAAIREALARFGIDASMFSGHSFRSGAATTAAKQGIGDATIKMLGRWKSSAYQLYIKTPKEQLAAISKRLVAGTS